MPSLWQHQRDILKYIRSRPSTLLYAGMSSGKTIIALELAANVGRNLSLVITPKSAMSVYADDVTNLYGDDYPKRLIVLDKGSSKAKSEQLYTSRNDNALVVVNYETARLLPLDRYTWDNVILDECHKIGQHNSKVSIGLTRMLAENVRFHRVVMSGTPFSQGYEKIYSIVRFLTPVIPDNPNAHPASSLFHRYVDYLYHYCLTYDIAPGVKGIRGYQNIDRLKDKLKDFTYFLDTSTVVDLPSLVSRRYLVTLDNPLRKAYNDYVRDNAIVWDDEYLFTTHLLTKIIRAQQLSSNGILTSDDGKQVELKGLAPRVQVLKDILELLPDEPVVIFTRFKQDVNIIKQALGGEPVALLTGDKDNHLDWRKGLYRVLIANIASGGVGTRLERAKHVIYWNIDFSNINYEQSISRVRRVGQVSDTVYQYVILSDSTIEVDIHNALERRKQDKQIIDSLLER